MSDDLLNITEDGNIQHISGNIISATVIMGNNGYYMRLESYPDAYNNASLISRDTIAELRELANYLEELFNSK